MRAKAYRFRDSVTYQTFIERETSERIFHITRYEHYLSVMRDGCLRGGMNPERNWSAPGFFVNCGCVCLLNNKKSYREGMPEADAELNSTKFPFSSMSFIYSHYGNRPVFLIVNDSVESELISWKSCKEQNRLSETVVPYYEAGYKGNLPMSKIVKVLLIRLPAPPKGGLASLLAASRKRRNV